MIGDTRSTAERCRAVDFLFLCPHRNYVGQVSGLTAAIMPTFDSRIRPWFVRDDAFSQEHCVNKKRKKTNGKNRNSLTVPLSSGSAFSTARFCASEASIPFANHPQNCYVTDTRVGLKHLDNSKKFLSYFSAKSIIGFHEIYFIFQVQIFVSRAKNIFRSLGSMQYIQIC